MYDYLKQHPGIYMPEHKEPNHFGADLHNRHGRLTRAEYERLFAPALPGQLVGEASTWSLYSRLAAGEIKEANPDARIVIMLRSPVDVMHSLHREMVFYRAETIRDFAAALAAEPDRLAGRRVPKGVRRVETLCYRSAVRFPEQVRRYLDTFPAEQVKLVNYDDLRSDPQAVYLDILAFLGADSAFVPSFERVNETKQPKSGLIQDLLVRPPFPLDRLIPLLRRAPILHRIRGSLVAMNSRKDQRPPMDEQLRARLEADVADEVRELAQITGWNLDSWIPSQVDGAQVAG